MKRFDNNINVALLGVILGVLITMVTYKALEPKRKFDGDYNRWRKLNLILQEVGNNYVDDIDMEAMNKAAELLLGEHDFSCFEKVGGNNATSVCTVTHACWSTYRPTHVELMGAPYQEGDYIVFRVKANRFLRNMVRAMVGSLIEVGRGKKDPSWISSLIESGSRSAAGQSVPGNALFFCGAEY